MKRSIQLVALLLTVFMGSCTGGKDKAAAEHVDAKPIVKLADVKARPVDQIQDYTATVEAEYCAFVSRTYRSDFRRSGRPRIQRTETCADGCSQPETDEAATR